MELRNAQSRSSKNKLSERNCVEILLKIQHMNKIKLIYTNSGREFLTAKQLIREIQDEIIQSGGRITVSDLSGRLNVDSSHIDSAVETLVAGGMRLIAGELHARCCARACIACVRER